MQFVAYQFMRIFHYTQLFHAEWFSMTIKLQKYTVCFRLFFINSHLIFVICSLSSVLSNCNLNTFFYWIVSIQSFDHLHIYTHHLIVSSRSLCVFVASISVSIQLAQKVANVYFNEWHKLQLHVWVCNWNACVSHVSQVGWSFDGKYESHSVKWMSNHESRITIFSSQLLNSNCAIRCSSQSQEHKLPLIVFVVDEAKQ